MSEFSYEQKRTDKRICPQNEVFDIFLALLLDNDSCWPKFGKISIDPHCTSCRRLYRIPKSRNHLALSKRKHSYQDMYLRLV